MLNFRNTNIFFAVLLIVIIGSDYLSDVSLFLYLAVILAYGLIVFYGCYFVDSNFFISIVCSAETTKKEIAISFDDGPVNNYTPQILQVLKEHNIQAAFFCIGNRINGTENILKAIHDEGHIIGNHSYSHHFFFDLFSSKKMLAELKMMDELTLKVTGVRPKLFRPPYGVTNPNVKRAILEGNYIPVGWSVRSMDTVIKDEKKLLKRINGSIEPGDVFLFHDTSKATLDILPDFIKKLTETGYKIVRLDKLLNLQAYA